jgi:hypothetical protein
MKVTIAAVLIFFFDIRSYAQQTSSLGIRFMDIPAGRFYMGIRHVCSVV